LGAIADFGTFFRFESGQSLEAKWQRVLITESTIVSEHIVQLRVYIIIFLALLVGTGLTVLAGLQDFPKQLNVIIALTIAVIKATLVVLYFMHVRYSARLIWVVFTSALFWLAILFALTLSDYWTRAWL